LRLGASAQPPGACILIGGDDAAELGMHRRAVEAFREVLGEQLPVRGYVEHDAPADPQIGEAVAAVALVALADGVGERRRVLAEMHENEPAPACRRDLE